MPETLKFPEGAIGVNYDYIFPDAPTPNIPPVCNAGVDQILTLPDTQTTLNGSASDPEGKIKSVKWSVIAGTGTIANPDQISTTVSGLEAGTNEFQLTVYDEAGAHTEDIVRIIVNKIIITPPAGYTQVYFNPFEKETDIRNNGTQQAGLGIIVTDPSIVREGIGCFLSIPQEGVSSGTRSEVQNINTPKIGYAEYWARYAYFTPNNAHSFQFHPSTNGGSASPGLYHENGKIMLKNWTPTRVDNYPTNYTPPLNTWIKIKLEWAFGTNGFFNFNVNDQLIKGWKGLVGDNSTPYAKCGVNGWDSSTTKSRVYYDSLRVFQKN